MKQKMYRILRPIIRFLMKTFYCIEIINNDNIPVSGNCILAGNHKSNFDGFLLLSCTKRTIRFMAKKELFDKFPLFFKSFGLIPVDRKRKNKEAMDEARKVLENNEIIGIFPEGTFNKTEYIVMPFKMGAVKLALDTNSPIVPFAIINNYKLFRRSVKIIFGKPYYITNTNDLKKENIILMNKVINLLKGV